MSNVFCASSFARKITISNAMYHLLLNYITITSNTDARLNAYNESMISQLVMIPVYLPRCPPVSSHSQLGWPHALIQRTNEQPTEQANKRLCKHTKVAGKLQHRTQ